jgi:hypothetical protein
VIVPLSLNFITHSFVWQKTLYPIVMIIKKTSAGETYYTVYLFMILTRVMGKLASDLPRIPL